jgi:CRISPR-associated endonuclease Cas2
MTNYLISYDITDDKLRTKIAKTLKAKACRRLQKSLFLAPAFKQAEIRALERVLNQILQSTRRTDSDSILCWPASDPQLASMLWAGDVMFFDKIISDPDFLIA